jgi:transposase InsO family protein
LPVTIPDSLARVRASSRSALKDPTMIDIASRRVVGFALADHLCTGLVSDALSNTVAVRSPEPGVIFRSDRGCQYTSAACTALAGECEVTLSVGRTGQCWDNALAGSFFSSLKGELIDTRAWPTRAGPGERSWSRSPGTTAPGCAHPSATKAQPATKTTTTKTSGK